MPRAASLAVVLFLSAACGGSPNAPAPPKPAVAISGLERYASLAPNMQVQLVATITAPGGAAQDCSATAAWSASNEAVLRLTGAKPGEFLIVEAGDASVTARCDGIAGVLPVHIDKPTSWPVSGRVLAGPGGVPIAGATLAFGSLAPVTTNADGEYTIITPDAAVQRLLITAPGFQTRDTFMRGGTLRAADIDLLGGDLLPLWRAMARNGHERPEGVETAPTRRWTQNPNIYIWTAWKDTGLPVANIEFYVQQIRRIIPQLSGGTLEAGLIEYGPSPRTPTAGWIGVQFDHIGNYASLGASPGIVNLGGDHACNHIAITHEFGHAMGYWHSGMFNTIMGTTPGYCHDADFTPNEQRVARAMYARARGNVEPDRDPDPSVPLLAGRDSEPILVTCPHIK